MDAMAQIGSAFRLYLNDETNMELVWQFIDHAEDSVPQDVRDFLSNCVSEKDADEDAFLQVVELLERRPTLGELRAFMSSPY
jgi:hypothetical protein